MYKPFFIIKERNKQKRKKDKTNKPVEHNRSFCDFIKDSECVRVISSHLISLKIQIKYDVIYDFKLFYVTFHSLSYDDGALQYYSRY